MIIFVNSVYIFLFYIPRMDYYIYYIYILPYAECKIKKKQTELTKIIT